MEDINEVALKLFNYKNCTVSNNLIKNSATGIYVYTGFKEKTSSSGMFFPPLNGIVNAEPSNHHIVIKNNTITKSKQFNKGYGDGIRVSGDTKHPIKGVTISNNKIKNTKRYGIFVSNCPKTTLKKNQIENVTKDGILLNADSNQSKIINNKVAKTNNYGIWVSEKTKNIHVKHNTVTACKKYGIFIYKTINSTILYNKIIQKTNISALHVGECTRTKISKNTIVGGKRGYEIWVTGTTNASVSQNTIR